MGFMLLIFLVFCVMLRFLFVFVLCLKCLFVASVSGLSSSCILCAHLLPVSLDCLRPVSCVPICCQCLWIVFVLCLVCPFVASVSGLSLSCVLCAHLLPVSLDCPSSCVLCVHLLPVSLDCPFLITTSVFSNVYCNCVKKTFQKGFFFMVGRSMIFRLWRHLYWDVMQWNHPPLTFYFNEYNNGISVTGHIINFTLSSQP